MEANFRRSVLAVLRHEGGYVDHVRDPGGATNRGITLQTLRDWRGKSVTKADVQNLTEAEAILIYKDRYWDRINGNNLPYGVDFAVLDFAVNSGVSRAAIYLQEIVGVAPDGKIGPMTLEAVHKWDSVKLIEKLCANRLAFLKRLSTWPTFGKGWSRRVSEVLHLAKDMAIALPQPPASEPEPLPTKKPPSIIALIISMILALFKRG